MGTQARADSRIGYVSALDGVRALAVLAVFGFHAGVGPFRGGGFLGVDLFFVVSGYLITALLLAEHAERGSIDLPRFWIRRLRRLAPALLLVLGVVAVAARWVTPADELDRLRGDLWGALGYVANWRFVASSDGYFATTSTPSPLQHTWSLAIEEQFYVVWPLAIGGLLWLGRGRRWLAGSFTVLAATASAAVAIVLHGQGVDVSRLYFGTDTRAQAILAGAVVAFVLGRHVGPVPARRGRLAGAAAAAALGLLLVVWATVNGSTEALYRGGLSGVAVLSAVVVGGLVRSPGGWLSRALSWPPLTWLGVRSYGIYLWHWPVIVTLTHARTGLGGLSLAGLRLAVTLALATLSFALVESPIRRGARLGAWRGAVALPTALVAVLAVGVWATAPATAPLTAPLTDEREIALSSAPVEASSGATPARVDQEGSRSPSGHQAPLRVALMGDSTALSLYLGWSAPAPSYGLDLRNGSILGCGLVRSGPFREGGVTFDLRDECRQWPEIWETSLTTAAPVDLAVVLLGRWEVRDRLFDGRWTQLGDPDFDAYVGTELTRAIDLLEAHATRVVVLTAPYYGGIEQPDGSPFPEDDPARVDRFNELLRQAADRRSTLEVVDLNRLLAPDGTYQSSIDDVALFRGDGVHYSEEGARWIGERLLPLLVTLAE